MEKYKNLSGDSPVIAFAITTASIVIRFKYKAGAADYTYLVSGVGAVTFRTMTQLAQAGRGLASFIRQQKPPYIQRLMR